jgi:ubiquinone/menaquinone biosynthesis C-methylase UbiE
MVLPNPENASMSSLFAVHGRTSPSRNDLEALKARQQKAWAAGDYAVVGTTLQAVGEDLCEALDVRAGERVLDVAAGNGNASLAAARRNCQVVASDYVPALLERAAERAHAERLPLEIRVADAEQLPFADGEFDVVLSTFGVMFTADHERAAAEMLRVCRSGGRIGMANWTPEGFIGQLFRTIGAYVPPPAGARSPAAWGIRERISELFFPQSVSIEVARRMFHFRYRSTQHWLEVFRNWYGPVLKAFAALDTKGQEALERDLLALAATFNRSNDTTMVVPGEYLEIVIRRR